MTDAERIAELEAQLADQKKKNNDVLVKIGNKKNVCVYNLGQRFPTTLYAPGWVKLIENIDKVKDFIDEHKDELSWER